MAEERDPFQPVGEEAVHRLIRENNDLFTDEQCKVCNAVLISESQKLSHYQSKKHASKVRRYMAIHKDEDAAPAKRMKTDNAVKPELGSNNGEDRNKCCPICNMTFSAPVVAASHYEGKIHAKNLRLKQQGPAPPGVSQKAPSTQSGKTPSAEETDPDKYCSLCDATFNNSQMAHQHYTGKKHAKNVNKSQLAGVYPAAVSSTTPSISAPTPLGSQLGYRCEDCKITLNSLEQYQAHISGQKHKAIVRALNAETEPLNSKPTWRSRPPPHERLLPPQRPPRFQKMYRPGDPEEGSGYSDRNY